MLSHDSEIHALAKQTAEELAPFLGTERAEAFAEREFLFDWLEEQGEDAKNHYHFLRRSNPVMFSLQATYEKFGPPKFMVDWENSKVVPYDPELPF